MASGIGDAALFFERLPEGLRLAPCFDVERGQSASPLVARAKAMRLALRTILIIPITNPPETSNKKLDGSGATVGTIAMAVGRLNPDIRAGFTGTPEVVYSPIVPPMEFVTKIVSARAVLRWRVSPVSYTHLTLPTKA